MKNIFTQLCITAAIILSLTACEKKDSGTINPPQPGFTIEKLNQYAPMRVKLRNTSQNADSYTWELGYDNQTSTEVSPEIEFPAAGTFTITLKARKGIKEVTASQQLVVEKDPDIAAYYPVDNTTGIVFDMSGHDMYAVLQYHAEVTEESRKSGGWAINLKPVDLVNFVKPYAEMPGSLLWTTGTATSVSLWFYRNASDKGCLLSCMDKQLYHTDPITQYTPMAYINEDTLYVKMWNGSVEPLIKKGQISTNTWHHLVIAGDATDQRAYLDGVLIGTIPGAISYLNMHFNYIGGGYIAKGSSWPGAPTGVNDHEEFHLNGKIDDIRVYKKKVSEAEVKALYME